MAHPLMFDENDPLLNRVRGIAHTFPEADEKVSHGRPAFFMQKVFCYFGGSERVDDGWIPHDAAIVVRPDPDDDPALRQDPRFWVPMYLGVSGWLGIDLDDATDWQEITDLIDASYRVTAPRRLVRELDER